MGKASEPGADADADATGDPDAVEFPVGGGVLSGRPADAEAPMTEVEAAELRRLCEDRGEAFDATLTRAEARIAALKG